MFLSTEHSKKVSTDYPEDCTFNENDWHILASFWHPVALSSEVKDKPFAVKLLDVNIVLWHTSDGISAAKDVCMHRGSRLSMGWIEDELIICPMHGLHYDSKGNCTKIPCIADPNAPISPKLRLKNYLVEEHYDMIWVCMKPEPINPLPVWKDVDNPEYTKIMIPYENWNASASRHAENFNDVAHHPWVHRKTFGNPNKTVMDDHEVIRTDYGLLMEIAMVELERGFNDPAGESKERPCNYIYDFTFPFATDLYVEDKEGLKTHFIDVASPISANESRIFQINLVNKLYCSEEEYMQYQIITNGEDSPIVEGQCPKEVPLDLREELHLPPDRFSLAYRKAIVEFGLGKEALN